MVIPETSTGGESNELIEFRGPRGNCFVLIDNATGPDTIFRDPESGEV